MSKYDYLYYPEWRSDYDDGVLTPAEVLQANLIFYEMMIKDGHKFTAEENKMFMDKFKKLQAMKAA